MAANAARRALRRLAKAAPLLASVLSGLLAICLELLYPRSSSFRPYPSPVLNFFGYGFGRGESLESILGSMTEVAEGVATARALKELVERDVKGYRKDLKYPILFGVSDILEDKLKPRDGR